MESRNPAAAPGVTGDDFVLEPGLFLRSGATVFLVENIHDNVAILKHTVSLEEKVILVPRLLGEILNGNVVVAEARDRERALGGDKFEEDDEQTTARLPLSELSKAQIDHVLKGTRCINGLRALGYTSLSPGNPTIQLDLDRLTKRLGYKKPIKASWVYKWSIPFDRSGGDPRSIIPRLQDRGGNANRIDPIVEEATARVLEAKKDEPNAKVRTYQIVSDIKSVLQTEHPNFPNAVIAVNWSTVDRRIKSEFSPYDLCRRNRGEAVAKQKYRDWYPREAAEFPLAVWETDDIDTDVFNIDERSGLPCGRAYLTGVIDQHSLIVPGLELSHKPRSVWSAVSAISKAILPTDPDDPDFAESKAGCEFYGKPGVVVFDNALYNHAKEIELAAHSMNFIPGWAKPKTPTEKAHQEGWNGRIKRDFLSTLPGHRGDKMQREGLNVGLAAANIGLQQFKQRLLKWTYDDYCNSPMNDGLTPRQKWHLGMRFSKPRIPRDIWGYRLVPCLHKTLKFRPEGIQFCGLTYSAPFLTAMRKMYGHNAEALISFNPGDLGVIYVQNPATKAYAPIPCANPEYAEGLSLYQHQLVRKLARTHRVRNPAIPQLLLYREELRKLTEQLRYSTRLLDHKKAIRTGDIPSQTPKGAATAQSKTIQITELESEITDIDDVEMEEGEAGWEIPEFI